MPGLSWERGREREKTRPRERANRPGLSLRACRGGASGGVTAGSRGPGREAQCGRQKPAPPTFVPCSPGAPGIPRAAVTAEAVSGEG